jgi:hypothetical protein
MGIGFAEGIVICRVLSSLFDTHSRFFLRPSHMHSPRRGHGKSYPTSSIVNRNIVSFD